MDAVGLGALDVLLQPLGGGSADGVKEEDCQNLRHGFELPLGVKPARVGEVGQQWTDNPEALRVGRAGYYPGRGGGRERIARTAHSLRPRACAYGGATTRARARSVHQRPGPPRRPLLPSRQEQAWAWRHCAISGANMAGLKGLIAGGDRCPYPGAPGELWGRSAQATTSPTGCPTKA